MSDLERIHFLKGRASQSQVHGLYPNETIFNKGIEPGRKGEVKKFESSCRARRVLGKRALSTAEMLLWEMSRAPTSSDK